MKNLEREDIYNIAKTITKEIVLITENPDEIKFLMDKVQSLVQDEVSFGEIENIIELVKKIKSTSKVEFQPIVELYIDRIIKLKNVKGESRDILESQASKISELTGLRKEDILKRTSLSSCILDSIVPSKEFNFKIIFQENMERFIGKLEQKSFNQYNDEGR